MSDELVLGPKVNPLVANLPAHLKDPANFDKIMKAVIATVQTTCNHSDLLEWGSCKKCTKKMVERRHLLKSLGFKNPAQFMAWRKIHETIKQRIPFPKYNTIV